MEPRSQRLVTEAKIDAVVDTAVSQSVTESLDYRLPPEVERAVAEATVEAVSPLATIEVDDIAFTVVDEDGRRTWLEATYEGKPTTLAASLLAPPVGEQVGVADQNTAITGIAFAVVDEDGRRTDLEVGEDGRFTQRVVNSLKQRMGLALPEDPTRFVLPSSIPVLVGAPTVLYYDSVIEARDPAHTVLTTYQGNAGTHWRYNPATAFTLSLGLRVVDRTGATVESVTVPVQSYTAPSGTGRRHLAIGDSITRAGNYVSSAVAPFTGATTVGTRTYNDGGLNVEGRGGWSLSGYFTNAGHDAYGDSPFLFPVGVAGEKFWGNTRFWRMVCYDDPTGYDYAGFQKIARGWGAPTDPFLFNATGYPTTPAEGDVVVDPSYEETDEFRQYTGGAWVRMDPQPAVEFSFPKYMARYAAAYPDGGPTSISVMLGTNDFISGVDDAKFTQWTQRMDQLIASVRAWSATVPIVLLCAPTGGPWENWVTQTTNKAEFDARMREAARRTIATYDTPTHRANRVYVASALGAVAEGNIADNVHPSTPTGHDQLAQPLAGMLARLITEGVA